MKNPKTILLVFLFILSMCDVILADNTGTWNYVQTIIAPENYQNNCATISISGDGNTAVAGGGVDGIYVYSKVLVKERSVWTKIQEFKTSDTAPMLGSSVCISEDGNTMIASSPQEGAVYFYTKNRSVWSKAQKITGLSIPVSSQTVSISRDGNIAIVGAGDENKESGAVYFYTKNGGIWTQAQKITGSSYSYFGFSVSISGDGNTAIVGAQYDDNFFGAAYIYSKIGDVWAQVKKVTPKRSTGDSSHFGFSVSISGNGNTAVVGAPTESADLQQNGAIYAYTKNLLLNENTWNPPSLFWPIDGQPMAQLGSSISLSNDGTIIAGAPGAGAAYIYNTVNGSAEWSASGGGVAISGDGSTVMVSCLSSYMYDKPSICIYTQE